MSGSVLVADDDGMMLLLLTAVLKERGLPCSTASSGTELRECLAHYSFDVVITDFNLGDETAETALEKVGALKGNPSIVIISGDTTGYARMWAERRAFLFLAKPFDVHEMMRLVSSALLSRLPGGTRA
jgi:DNA-binding NtrC family response regulator